MQKIKVLLFIASLAPLLASGQPESVGKFEVAYPFPASDGQSVVVQANFDGRWQLYRIALEDGQLSRLHESEGDDTHPALSPDGARLAFISNRDGNDEVYILNLATGKAQSVAPHPGKDGHPKWSADGQWLVFNRTFDPADVEGDGDSALLRVRPDGSDLEVISDTPRIETFASFSPDGESVALVEWFENAEGEHARNGEIVVIDLSSGKRRNLTNSYEFDAYPHWGPSGEWIYYSTPVTAPSGERQFIVQRIAPNGSCRQNLTTPDGMSDRRAIPNADETVLFYNQTRNGQTLVYQQSIQPGECLSE